MRREKSAEAHSAAGVTGSSIPWFVSRVTPLSDYRLHVEFVDGVAGEVEMRELVGSAGAGVFAELRDQAVFAKARVEDGVVTWPGGQDLAPDAMYDAIRRDGAWTPK